MKDQRTINELGSDNKNKHRIDIKKLSVLLTP